MVGERSVGLTESQSILSECLTPDTNYKELQPIVILKGAIPKISLTSDTNCNFRACPKPLWGYNLPGGFIELTESSPTHVYGLLQGEDTNLNQPKESHTTAFGGAKCKASIIFSCGVRMHYCPGISVWQCPWSVINQRCSSQPQSSEGFKLIFYV